MKSWSRSYWAALISTFLQCVLFNILRYENKKFRAQNNKLWRWLGGTVYTSKLGTQTAKSLSVCVVSESHSLILRTFKDLPLQFWRNVTSITLQFQWTYGDVWRSPNQKITYYLLHCSSYVSRPSAKADVCSVIFNTKYTWLKLFINKWLNPRNRNKQWEITATCKWRTKNNNWQSLWCYGSTAKLIIKPRKR